MYSGLKYFAVFSLGAAAGVFATYKFVKTKYERLAREEVEEVREYYSIKYEDDSESLPAVTPEDVDGYADMVSGLRYDNTDEKGGSCAMAHSDPEPGTSGYDPGAPYVITPEEFAADEEYQTESLTLYACGTLTDDFDNPIEDVYAMVGDALSHFGEYEDDCVFVRNDRYKCNYEVLRDVRNFDDVKNRALSLTDSDE